MPWVRIWRIDRCLFHGSKPFDGSAALNEFSHTPQPGANTISNTAVGYCTSSSGFWTLMPMMQSPSIIPPLLRGVLLQELFSAQCQCHTYPTALSSCWDPLHPHKAMPYIIKHQILSGINAAQCPPQITIKPSPPHQVFCLSSLHKNILAFSFKLTTAYIEDSNKGLKVPNSLSNTLYCYNQPTQKQLCINVLQRPMQTLNLPCFLINLVTYFIDSL